MKKSFQIQSVLWRFILCVYKGYHGRDSTLSFNSKMKLLNIYTCNFLQLKITLSNIANTLNISTQLKVDRNKPLVSHDLAENKPLSKWKLLPNWFSVPVTPMKNENESAIGAISTDKPIKLSDTFSWRDIQNGDFRKGNVTLSLQIYYYCVRWRTERRF